MWVQVSASLPQGEWEGWEQGGVCVGARMSSGAYEPSVDARA
jgi:hypothetical protein